MGSQDPGPHQGSPLVRGPACGPSRDRPWGQIRREPRSSSHPPGPRCGGAARAHAGGGLVHGSCPRGTWICCPGASPCCCWNLHTWLSRSLASELHHPPGPPLSDGRSWSLHPPQLPTVGPGGENAARAWLWVGSIVPRMAAWPWHSAQMHPCGSGNHSAWPHLSFPAVWPWAQQSLLLYFLASRLPGTAAWLEPWASLHTWAPQTPCAALMRKHLPGLHGLTWARCHHLLLCSHS